MPTANATINSPVAGPGRPAGQHQHGAAHRSVRDKGTVPLIVVSAMNIQDIDLFRNRVGAFAVVLKPFELAHLVDVVRESVAEARRWRAEPLKYNEFGQPSGLASTGHRLSDSH